MNTKFKQAVIDKYVQLTGDTDHVTSRLVPYRASLGGYFDIWCGPLGDAKREELTYYDLSRIHRRVGYGWRVCTIDEEQLARSSNDHNFTREDPSTIGHVSFTKTPELLSIVKEIDEDFYIIWTKDSFHVEWRV